MEGIPLDNMFELPPQGSFGWHRTVALYLRRSRERVVGRA